MLLSIPAARLQAQADLEAPFLQSRFPAPGVLLQGLNQVEVIFNEDVQGVDASDLLINNVPATDLLFGVPGQFVFEFPSPATGVVTIAFAPTHGITDLATPPNPFGGASWTVTVDPNSQPATFLITEFMASNTKTLNDEDGDKSDWIEIYNPRSAAGNLEGWFLTDDAANLTKWRFPNRTLEANSYLVVFASSKNRTNLTGNLHTSFNLSASGEYLALLDPNTNVVSAFSPFFPAQQPDVSYGRSRTDPSVVGYFPIPTPGAPNAVGGPGFAPEVQFSLNSRTFLTNQPFSLVLTSAVPDARIYYSFGSNAPSSNSTSSALYSGPIRITNTTAIRARSYATGLLPGPITTKTYIGLANQTNIVNFNSDLPIMVLHNYGQGTVPNVTTIEHYVFVQTFESVCGRASMTNVPTLSARGIFHTRGSSTLTASDGKASFFLEIRDEFDEDLEVPLLGLPQESDWVLYAPNGFEPVLMHNPLAHVLTFDMGEYSSRTRFFELYLKDNSGSPDAISSGDYMGIYVLEEKIKRDNNRVNIAKLEPEHVKEPEVTGGYMFSIDRSPPGTTALSAGGANLNWIEPSYFTMTNAVRAPQKAWITGYLNAFNSGLTGPSYTNVTSTNFYGNYINVDSWVRRHIHEVATFNVDGLRLSGFLFKDRGKKIEYGPAWDYDRTQGSTDTRDFNPRVWRSTVPDLGTDFFNFSPWWNRLFTAPDFWQAWIDKYQSYRRPGQPLSMENITAHINRFANEVREAQPRERARWGITPRSGTVSAGGFTYNFGPVPDFQNEVTWITVWYSNRLDFMDTNFLPPPLFSSPGGPVSSGYVVTLYPGPKAGSSLVYTLDGTDPRLSGGAIAPNVITSPGTVLLTLTSNVHIFARTYNPTHRNLTGANNPPISSPWSGPTEASFYLSLPPLRITEIMYHPADPPAGSPFTADDFEYIEFTNIGSQPLDLNRFRLRGGVDFDFGNVLLAPGQAGVLVRNQAAFMSRYGAAPVILGVYTNDNLSNNGESLKLYGSLNEPILDFEYKDSWYPATDGAGFSLVIVDPNASPTTWGVKESWRPSGSLQGTPGTSDAVVSIPPVLISEISTHNDPPSYDAIELFNPTASTANIGGWFLTDNHSNPKKFRLPAGTVIPAEAYLVLYATNLVNPSLAFGSAVHLGATGGEIYLYSADPGTTNLTGYAHGFDFGAQASGVTFGRYLTSSGGDQYPAMATPTLGLGNSQPQVGPVVISEINYHPPDIQFTYRAVDNCLDEYIELQNLSTSPVPLYDPAHATNAWKLRDAVKFTFPAGASIPAGGIVLVVPIDPANAQQAAEFRLRNLVPDDVTLYGPYDGKLDNSGASVELVRPDGPRVDSVPYILVERVKYSDDAPWPLAADGFGSVLQRVSLTGYANDVTNWVSAARSPGTSAVLGAGPLITAQPTNNSVLEGSSASFSVAVSSASPVKYQWFFNGDLLPGQIAATLTLPSAQIIQAGQYSCLVYNASGSVLSSEATLGIRALLRIILSPSSVAIRGSTNLADYGFTTNNATFSVLATGGGLPHYQWRFNGNPIPGATASILTLFSVGLTNDGLYDCVIHDDLTSVTSASGRLAVLISPVFVIPPVSQVVPSNGSFTASAVLRGNPPPFRFEWREISNPKFSNVVNSATNIITYGPITNTASRQWRLLISNEAATNFISFNVVAVPDLDGDGIPDSWETQYGLNPADAKDRDLDADKDGASNYAEYLAGTDPTNALSFLRIEQAITPGSALVKFSAISNRTYTLRYRDELGTGLWKRLVDVPARTSNRLEVFTDPAWTTNRFYQVITPSQ